VAAGELDRNLGLVDRIKVKLVPVLLGDGIRLFSQLNRAPIELDNPQVTEGNGVTHLYYNVPAHLPGHPAPGSAC